MELSTRHLVLAPDALIDLQLHTVYSDGTWTAEGLIDLAASEGFGLLAITDHDRVDTAERLQQLALEKGMPMLVAAEITASWKGEMTDVLCYGFDPHHTALKALTQDVLRRQQENSREVYDYFIREGYTFPQEGDVLAAILEKPSAAQPHAWVELLKKHGYGTGEPSLGKIFKDAHLHYATTEIAAVVNAGHQSGAVCLIAHPGRSDGFVCYDAALLDELRQEVPIDGLEVYYPKHSPEQTALFKAYAEQHGLLMSSGSDSHAPDQKPIPYRAELSRKLLERLGIQVK